MGLPQVTINFKTLGTTAIKRGERGVVLVIIKDSGSNGNFTLQSATDIPTGLTAANKTILTSVFVGNDSAPLRVLLSVLPSAAADYTAGLTWAETQKFDYLVIPSVTGAELTTINSWVATQRTNNKLIKFVSPSNVADKEYIYNFTGTGIVNKDSSTVTTAAFCARLAGAIAGTPLTKSVTYMVFPEVAAVESLNKSQLDSAIDSGQIKLLHDGEKVKLARGVTSLTTTSTTKGEPFKKIKLVETMDLISSDIRKTIEDNYIGKVSNSYDNKVLLCVAIKGYLKTLEAEGLLALNSSVVEIDVESTRNYLTSIGIDCTKLTDQQIKEYDTRDKVFVAIKTTILDAMEEFTLNVVL